MWGGFLAIRCRSEGVVSPIRTAARISGKGVPAFWARADISFSGVARFFWISFERALRGRYVNHLGCICKPLPKTIADQAVDASQKRCQGLAGTSGGGYQGVSAPGNGGPASGLGRSGGLEPATKPFLNERVEQGQRHRTSLAYAILGFARLGAQGCASGSCVIMPQRYGVTEFYYFSATLWQAQRQNLMHVQRTRQKQAPAILPDGDSYGPHSGT